MSLNDRRIYADGTRMALYTPSAPEVLVLPRIVQGFIQMESHEDCGMVVSRKLSVQIECVGEAEFTIGPEADAIAAQFRSAAAMTIEELLAVVHQKMRDRGEEAAAILRSLPPAT